MKIIKPTANIHTSVCIKYTFKLNTFVLRSVKQYSSSILRERFTLNAIYNAYQTNMQS
jgi:hypothetical protein